MRKSVKPRKKRPRPPRKNARNLKLKALPKRRSARKLKRNARQKRKNVKRQKRNASLKRRNARQKKQRVRRLPVKKLSVRPGNVNWPNSWPQRLPLVNVLQLLLPLRRKFSVTGSGRQALLKI